MPKIGEVIRRRRRSLDISQESLADSVGISPAYVSKIEREQADPSASLLEKFADALGCSTRDLFEVDVPSGRVSGEVPSGSGRSVSFTILDAIPMQVDGSLRGSRSLQIDSSPDALWIEMSEPISRGMFPFLRPGDLVLIRAGVPVRPGDLVAARWDGNHPGGVFFYQDQGDRVVLSSVNPQYPPVILDRSRVTLYRVTMVRYS